MCDAEVLPRELQNHLLQTMHLIQDQHSSHDF